MAGLYTAQQDSQTDCTYYIKGYLYNGCGEVRDKVRHVTPTFVCESVNPLDEVSTAWLVAHLTAANHLKEGQS